MSVLGNPLLLGPEGYQISRSVRLRSSASAYFNRTPASAGNRQIYTWSGWVKRGTLSANFPSLFWANNGTTSDVLQFNNSDALRFFQNDGISSFVATSAVFRDPSAWYHVVLAVDTTQATASNRVKIYVNGVSQNLNGSTYPTQNYSGYFNNTFAHRIGDSDSFDGYLTEVNFIDGQALTPSSFGETDSITGVWKPKKYSGTYGTNGFYLNFSDNSAATAAAIGKDNSGNGNNWTPNNISVTAGATYDSMLDVPTMWADGGNGRGNYATLNPLFKAVNTSGLSLTEANLKATGSANNTIAQSAFAVKTGKWYFEASVSGNGGEILGWALAGVDFGAYPGNGSNAFGNYITLGRVYFNNTFTAYGSGSTATTIGLAIDFTNNKAYWSTNGTWQNSADPSAGTGGFDIPAGLQGVELAPSFRVRDLSAAENIVANFGQRPFAYTPPTGFKALNTQNLPEPTIKKGNQYFDATTYTGNGGTQSIVNAGGFQPDLVWVKSRSAATSNDLFDSVRGATLGLTSNATSAEGTWSGVTAFNSNGFTLGSNTSDNASAASYAAWQWKESPSAGFDIVTYTGTGANRTVAHSLGVQPKMVLIKQRNGITNWAVNHVGIWSTGQGVVYLNLTNANSNDATFWNSTNPTTTDIYLGTNASVNGNGNADVAYLFSEVAGFSKFGSYTGNGSADGPFVFCGFRPRWVMIKRTDAVEGWYIYDTARDTFNVLQNELRADSSAAESAFASRDFLSNGFKIRTANGSVNTSGGTYIYAAFAENPFKNSLAR